jgi:hypothetical protein
MIEVGTEGVGTNAHAILTRDGRFVATVMLNALDILSPEVREQVLAKMAPGAEEKAK